MKEKLRSHQQINLEQLYDNISEEDRRKIFTKLIADNYDVNIKHFDNDEVKERIVYIEDDNEKHPVGFIVVFGILILIGLSL